jgi:hypothetical protein
MKVEVDSGQIQQLEGNVEAYMGFLLALTVKFGDKDGVLRLSTADMNKANEHSFSIKPLKKGVVFKAKRAED